MLIITFLSHIALAILLFFAINWIGKHSVSIGYIEITIFSQNEDNPAFNFLIRVLCPQVFLIVVATFLYAVKLDMIVKDIYLVSIYYVVFRFLASVLMGRLLLLNWYKQVLYWLAITSLSYVLYDQVIQYRKNIFPDLATLSNELWIVIVVFVYQVMNNLDFSSPRAAQRREIYIRNNFLNLKSRYGRLIHGMTNNESLDAIVYAILIYEDFNRPRITRWIEYLVFFLNRRKPRTLGIMQFRSSQYIDDEQSVKLGTRKIIQKFLKLKASPEWDTFENEHQIAREIVSDYNSGDSYATEVISLMYSIKEQFYPNSSDEFLVVA